MKTKTLFHTVMELN